MGATNATLKTEVNEHGDSIRYSIAYQSIASSLFTSLFLIGIFGNILVIVVVFKSQKMKTVTNFYLVSLACADILVLISGTLPAIPELFLYRDQYLYGPVFCALFVFLQYLGINASALSITGFTVERYLGICYPIKAQVICTLQRAKYIIACIWAFSILYNGCWLYLATTVEHNITDSIVIQTCTFRIEREQYSYVYMVDLILFYVVPLILTCTLYTCIAVTLHRSVRSLSLGSPPNENLQSVNPNTDVRQSMLSGSEAVKKLQQSRLQVVKMLIVVALLFAILWLPYRAWVVYNSFVPESERFYNDWYFLMARTMVFINNAMNPILYSAMSKKFRHAFITQTCLRKMVQMEGERRGLRGDNTGSMCTYNASDRSDRPRSQYIHSTDKSVLSTALTAQHV